jgi:hypothetical protein
MMMMKKLILNIAAIVCLQNIVFAQNNNSPYSIIGIGSIEHSYFDRTSGMGHSGMSLSSNNFLYNANAASLSALDDKTFHAEISTSAKFINYSGTPISASASASSDLQIKKFSLAIKLKPKWGASFGLLPYSSANYSFYGNKYIFGTYNSTSAYYQGSGSINQFYFSNGYQLTKRLSLGLQAAYLFGQLTQTENINSGVGLDSALMTTRKIVVGTPYFKPGFQYNSKLNHNWKLFVGGTATFKASMNGDYKLSVVDGNTTLPTYSGSGQAITIPAQYAGSIAAKLKDQYTFSVDYSFQNWGDLNSKGVNYRLVNSNFFGAGFEFSKKQTFRDVSFERHFFQIGGFYSNSYLQVNGQPISNYGVTFGGGKNLMRSNLGVQLNMELGVHGTTTAGLIEERYAQVNFILTYRDFWYVKVKKFD